MLLSLPLLMERTWFVKLQLREDSAFRRSFPAYRKILRVVPDIASRQGKGHGVVEFLLKPPVMEDARCPGVKD